MLIDCYNIYVYYNNQTNSAVTLKFTKINVKPFSREK